jgi:hypothetical protein
LQKLGIIFDKYYTSHLVTAIVDHRWEVFPYGTLTEKAYQAEKIATSITILPASYFA